MARLSEQSRKRLSEMDQAKVAAATDLLNTVSAAAAQEVAEWAARWKDYAGYKRIGQILVSYAEEGLPEEGEGDGDGES